MITDFISNLEFAKVKTIHPTSSAEDQWVGMVDEMAQYTLFPLTNSWWTGGNIPGKKPQMLTYVLGIQQYETTCREILDCMKGFEVEYEDGKKTVDTELPIKAATAS